MLYCQILVVEVFTSKVLKKQSKKLLKLASFGSTLQKINAFSNCYTMKMVKREGQIYAYLEGRVFEAVDCF